MAGARFNRDGELFENSPTPYTVDFFSTAFAGPAQDGAVTGTGFFAGAQCKDDATPFDELEDCKREPAIYRFAKDGRGDQQIERVFDPDEDDPDDKDVGFVGAVAWIDSERALAVGGTGIYPRRESATPVDDPAYADPAGDARAWLYENGSWRELQDLPDPAGGFTGEGGDEIPDEAKGMTALACDQTNSPLHDHCLAGGLQRLWWWRPGSGDELGGFDPEPVRPVDVSDAAGQPDFHFRARAIGVGFGSASVATSGCCAAPGSPSTGPRILSYDQANDTWRSDQFTTSAQGISNNAEGYAQSNLTNLQNTPGSPTSISGWNKYVSALIQSIFPPTEDVSALADDVSHISARRVGAETASNGGSLVLPDSYYDFGGGAVIASPGGPSAPGTGEPGSRILRTNEIVVVGSISPKATNDFGADLTARSLDSVRLLAADGDFTGPPMIGNEIAGLPGSDFQPGPDGLPDWSVGRLKESELGVAYTTVPALVPVPNPLSCTLGSTACEPVPENLTEASSASKRLVDMGTYALNTLSFVPGTNGGTAWAAGDRGALARLGGDGSVGAGNEPPAPSIRARGAAELSDREPFDARRPAASTTPGLVPPLAAQPFVKLPKPALVPYGTDNPMPTSRESVSAFAMSRDGSEGWAIGSSVHHFDGTRWVQCGVASTSDRGCASLLNVGGGTMPRLESIVRVPLENDSDPTNDDEFAAMAIGTTGSGEQGKVIVLAYRRGVWTLDTQASETLKSINANATIAFRAPDDGWLSASSTQGSGSFLFHYGGGDWPAGRWSDCHKPGTFNFADCGPSISSLPIDRSLHPQFAGETLYVAGTRLLGGAGQGVVYPFVAAKDPDASAPWRIEYDPGCPESQQHPPDSQQTPNCSGSPDSSTQGTVSSLTVVEQDDGSVAGWLLGQFGTTVSSFDIDTLDAVRDARERISPAANLIRRDPDSGEWSHWTAKDAASDYLPIVPDTPPAVVGAKTADGKEAPIIVPDRFINTGLHPWLAYDPEKERWRVLETPFISNLKFALTRQAAAFASNPDGQGGMWVAIRQGVINAVNMPDQPLGYQVPTYFYHYTDRAPKPVFEDAPHPIREPISDLDSTADGTVWVSTYSNHLYRYDRITGWERVPIPGWDPGRTVTNPSAVGAIAVNDAGVGVAVGAGGRIADISPDSVRLDQASGRRCSDVPAPCGTPTGLRAAAVASDGSALVGGGGLTLIWRPAGGDFRLVGGPPISVGATITAISMPAPDSAWLTTANGEIWAGTLADGKWHWGEAPESSSSAAADETGWARLNAIEVDAEGRGLAVGARGAMLERFPDGTWRRLNTGYLDDLYSIALPPSGYGDGTLVGGSVGIVLTRTGGEFHLARRSDIFDPVTNGNGSTAAARIVGVAITGGDSDGEVEAWAASQIPVEAFVRRSPEPQALLHYASGDDPLLHPPPRTATLPDAPEPTSDELALAAFGRSECQIGGRLRFCPEFQGSNMFNEVVTRRIQDEISARSAETQGQLAALFTGEINTAPGREQQWERALAVVGRPNTPLDVNATHNTWRDMVGKPLIDDGVPLFAALGRADLSGISECVNPFTCPGTRDVRDAVVTDVGLSNMWRSTFAHMPSPWGEGGHADSEGIEFDPVDASLLGAEVADEGANTHYAADVSLDGEGVARLVVVDNSLGSLAESTINQNPVEEQQVWLESALCFEGSADDTDGDARDCTRERGQEAIVLANYPTYTYATNISPTDVATDGALFESTLLRYDVDVLITGRLGWNGLYYACAPGLHYPAPGQGYPERAPKGVAECLAAAGGGEAPDEVSNLSSTATDAVSGTPTGALPVVVASGAGGRFGPRGDSEGSASEGFWRGYAIVRIDPDTGKVTVEQRPVLDWVGLTTPQLVIEPKERVELNGFGREPAAIDVPLRYIDIDSPAVTHRYDLLLADPDEPWVPCEASDADCQALHSKLGEGSSTAGVSGLALQQQAAATQDLTPSEGAGDNPCEPYLCLPESVGTVDDQTGEVRAGNGKYPDTFAIAMLSMGDHVATQPLYFKKSPSFVVNAAVAFPAVPGTPVSTGTAPAPPPPPSPPTPNVPQPNVPAPPPVPPIAPLSATEPPEPQPPAPPAPPPPTEQPAPLSLTVTPPGIAIATPTAVIQPPTPPVNPAPPGGARREARQRQAAAQKSGAGLEEEGTENPDAVDKAHLVGDDEGNAATRRERPSPRELSATRRDRVKPGHSLTAIRATEQPSAWVRGLLYTGGLGVGALVLALGAGTLRPTPGRREPSLPAPACSWTRWKAR